MRLFLMLVVGSTILFNQCQNSNKHSENINFSIFRPMLESFDFSSREFTRCYSGGDTVSVKIIFTENEIQQIKDWYIKFKLYEVEEDYYPRGTFNSLPVFTTILVVNDKKITLTYDTSYGLKDYFKVKRTRKFIDNVFSLVKNKAEVKRLPRTDIIFF